MLWGSFLRFCLSVRAVSSRTGHVQTGFSVPFFFGAWYNDENHPYSFVVGVLQQVKEKREQPHLKKLDGVIVLAAILLSLLPLAVFGGGRDGTAVVRIEQHGMLLYSGSLSEDALITTPDGGNTIEIRDGTVRMTHADCADGLCLAAGAATARRPIVCLPNEVTVTVVSTGEVGYDALTE